MEVAVFGGTFNPIHYGHVHIIKMLLKKYKMVFVLVSDNHRYKKNINNIILRIKKIQEKIKNLYSIHLRIMIDNFESSYDLLKFMSYKYKNFKFNFVIGYDNLINIHEWHNSQLLLDTCNKLIVFVRDNYIYKYCKIYHYRASHKIKVIFTRRNKISSTYLRKQIN